MDQKWLEEQKEEIGLALAKQGIRLVVPVEKQSRKEARLQLRIAPLLLSLITPY